MKQFLTLLVIFLFGQAIFSQNQSGNNKKNSTEEVGAMVILPPPGDGGSLWNRDVDGDGYGDPNVTTTSSSQPMGYVANALDCDDTNALKNPGTIWYKDADGDGYGDPSDTRTQCSQPSTYILAGGDCDDSDASTNPETIWYRDVDGDGFGTASPTATGCTQPAGYSANSDDKCPNDPGPQAGCPAGNVTLSDENYVFKRLYRNEVFSPLTVPTTDDVIDEITYFDGLGRPMQHIAIRQGANDESDIVTHLGYDDYGREDKKYLSYPDTVGLPGELKTGTILKTQNRYKSIHSQDFEGVLAENTNPYSETHFEASPLNRVLEQGAPGTAWAVNKNSDTDYTIKFNYESNLANEVRLYSVSLSSTYAPTLIQSTTSYYGAGDLYKNITKDENWTSGVNNTSEEFKDKQGRVVLKRTYNAGAAHDTYYVYDDYGNLTYVIPPKVVTSDGISATELAELCYQYRYDGRNRLIEKKLPGKGIATNWESIVYNKLDQPIMTQDPNLKAQNKWLFTKYDAFGRVVYTGLVTRTASRTTLQAEADAYTSQFENRGSALTLGGTSIYYTNNAYPKSYISEIHTENYYDTYLASSAQGGIVVPAANSLGESTSTATKGLPTVSKVRVLDTSNWITTVSAYDKKGRVIWSKSINSFLGTTDLVESDLDFIGNIEVAKATHSKSGQPTIVTVDNFTYDHVNRLKTHTQSINGSTPEVIASNEYDKLGQLKSRGVGNEEGKSRLQTVDYTYNVRGWLKQINNPAILGTDLFSFGINYNTVDHSGAPLFNGNIAETEWRTANTDSNLKWYRYGYDHLNRITSAIANSSNYNVSGIMYDKNGNITTLTRGGAINSTSSSFGEMDKLTYIYDSGNKLQIVSDAGNDTYGFKDDLLGTAMDSSTDYTYDTNGNMKTDLNKGITAITYNHLNLPKSVSIGGGTITFIYDATGVKLQKKVVESGQPNSYTFYAGNYLYKRSGDSGSGTLQIFHHPEGYVENNAGSYKYHYQYKDHLGNIRLSYFNNGTALSPSVVISEENNYYPFGLRHKGYNDAPNGHGNSAAKMFKFGGKELQDETIGGKNIDWYDFGARNYDAALGRWMNIDPLAEDYISYSPYNAMMNNPINFIDPTGMAAEWIPNLNEDGSTSYIAEQGDSAKTLSSQYGISQKDAEAITGTKGDTKIDVGTEISGQKVSEVNPYNLKGNNLASRGEVLKLDLNSPEGQSEQRRWDHYVYSSDQSTTNGGYAFQPESYFSNINMRSMLSGNAMMCIEGTEVRLNYDIPLYRSATLDGSNLTVGLGNFVSRPDPTRGGNTQFKNQTNLRLPVYHPSSGGNMGDYFISTSGQNSDILMRRLNTRYPKFNYIRNSNIISN